MQKALRQAACGLRRIRQQRQTIGQRPDLTGIRQRTAGQQCLPDPAAGGIGSKKRCGLCLYGIHMGAGGHGAAGQLAQQRSG